MRTSLGKERVGDETKNGASFKRKYGRLGRSWEKKEGFVGEWISSAMRRSRVELDLILKLVLPSPWRPRGEVAVCARIIISLKSMVKAVERCTWKTS